MSRDGLRLALAVALCAWPGLGSAARLSGAVHAAEALAGGPLVVAQSSGPAAPAPSASQAWLGKRFVAKTDSYQGPGPVLHETEIPPPYRIFRPDRMIGDQMYDPARTNIYLDERSVVVRVTKG
jgi:hypothetical protein